MANLCRLTIKNCDKIFLSILRKLKIFVRQQRFDVELTSLSSQNDSW